MDLTSLLNSNTNAAEQRKKADGTISRAVSRNRTPWDAGGYSLPINTAQHCVKILQPENQCDRPEIRHDDSFNTPPSSPRHRFSDSRSSLSSFASSLQSATTHSRFSSTSTLNSNFPTHHKTQGTEILSPELRSISQALEESSDHLLATDSYHFNGSKEAVSLSPTGSPLEQLALVAECHTSEMREEGSRRSLSEIKEIMGTEPGQESGIDSATPKRPGSPSDAILIKRTLVPSLHLKTSNLGGQIEPTTSSDYKRSKPSLQKLSLLQNKSTHRRNWSEPDIRSSTTTYFESVPSNFSTPTYYTYSDYSLAPGRNMVSSTIGMAEGTPPPTLNLKFDVTASATAAIVDPIAVGPRPEPTPPSSHRPEDISPTTLPMDTPTVSILASIDETEQAVTPVAPAAQVDPVALVAPGPVNRPTIVCMYVDNCDTGSQLRKAISHIFGRNKMCTRQIPDDVWVFYCRKHYQRVRYRNSKHYAQLQCILVQEQLKRIHEWSEDNRTNGRNYGVVENWSLAVRKREKERHEKEQKNKRKRGDDAEHAEHDNKNEIDHDAQDNLSQRVATAVPEWLRPLCDGTKFTTAEILEHFNRLHREILAGDGQCNFPDLEILPNITTDSNAPNPPKGVVRQSGGPTAANFGATTGQKHVAGIHRRSVSMNSVPSTQDAWENESLVDHQDKKRRRSQPTDREVRTPMGIALPNGRRRMISQPFPIPEHHHEEPAYETYPEHDGSGGDRYGGGYDPRDSCCPHCPHTRYAPQVPMAVPVPQRMRNSASHLERGGPEYGYDRYYHGRSQSDAGYANGYTYTGPQSSPYARGYATTSARDMHAMRHAVATAPMVRNYTHPHAQPQYAASSNTQQAPQVDAGYATLRTHARHQSSPIYRSSAPNAQQNISTPPARSPSAARVPEDEKAQQFFLERR